MGRLELRQLVSTAELRAVAPAWDDLWHRGEVSLPTARAELVAQWIEWFASESRLSILTVSEDDKMLAALPLVGRRLRRVLTVGDMTMNYWSPNGELLLDPVVDPEPVLDLLVEGMNRAPWPLLWFDMVPAETPRWRALAEAFRRREMLLDVHWRYEIGVAEFQNDFKSFRETLSPNLRRSLRKDSRRLDQAGEVAFEVRDEFAPDEVDVHLRELFALEHRGWKGPAGGSVLSTPGMFEFYCRQARQLAEWGSLLTAVLKHRGNCIAFELGWVGKETYHSYKVGYDPLYRQYGPGHLLRMRLIEWFHEHPGYRQVDFQGPTTEALSGWATSSYPIARWVVAPLRLSSQICWAAYHTAAPLVRRLRLR